MLPKMLLSRSRPIVRSMQKALVLRCSSTAVHEESAQTSTSPTPSTASSPKSAALPSDKELRGLPGFPLIYPDFVREPVWGRRHPLKEKLERQDMLRRRMNIDIPEFYVGSVLAVTLSDKYAPGRQRRFVGICIRREKTGLHHNFTLRNVIDGLGVEIKYDLYNPNILKIETLKLERRLDSDLSYLRDALPEYSTFDFDMEPVPHAVGTAVPINTTKVKLRPPPWQSRWETRDLKGIDDAWTNATAYFKRKFSNKTKLEPWKKYDLVADYRVDSYREDEEHIQDEIRAFEKEQQEIRGSKKRLLKSASHPVS